MCVCVLSAQVLDDLKVKREMDRDILVSVARTALRTKLSQSVADHLAEVCDVK